MFQSETYGLWDCIKYDNETIPIENSIFTKGSGSDNASFTRENGYTNFSEITVGTDCILYTQIPHECTIEFDIQIITTDYSRQYGALGQSPNAQTRFSLNYPQNIRNNDWHHVKIVFNKGTGTIAYDNNSPVDLTVTGYDSTLNMYFRFVTGFDITGVNYQNFKVYPI